MNKHIVVISKQWRGDAPIEIDVTDVGIGVSMPLNAFVDALAQEVGNPALLMTVAGLRSRLEGAAAVVCEKMKKETTKVM